MLIYCVQLIYHERFMNFIEMGIEMHFISSENCVCSFVNATAVVCVTESNNVPSSVPGACLLVASGQGPSQIPARLIKSIKNVSRHYGFKLCVPAAPLVRLSIQHCKATTGRGSLPRWNSPSMIFLCYIQAPRCAPPIQAF